MGLIGPPVKCQRAPSGVIFSVASALSTCMQRNRTRDHLRCRSKPTYLLLLPSARGQSTAEKLLRLQIRARRFRRSIRYPVDKRACAACKRRYPAAPLVFFFSPSFPAVVAYRLFSVYRSFWYLATWDLMKRWRFKVRGFDFWRNYAFRV